MTTKNAPVGVLPFNPVSDRYHALNNGNPIDITPEMARYILVNHNGENRPISKTQVLKISKSIVQDAFYEDGQPITFNTSGNLTEKQHTLKAISTMPKGTKFSMLVVVGVEPDCFSKATSARTRTAKDELQRRDPRATNTDFVTLCDLLRRQGIKTVTNIIVYPQWVTWKNSIAEGLRISDAFFSTTNDSVFTQIRKTMNAFCTLGYCAGLEDEISTLLEYLTQVYVDDGFPTTLALGFDDYFTQQSKHMHNTKKGDMFFAMLCHALDLLIERQDGLIRFVDRDDKEFFATGNWKDIPTLQKLKSIKPA